MIDEIKQQIILGLGGKSNVTDLQGGSHSTIKTKKGLSAAPTYDTDAAAWFAAVATAGGTITTANKNAFNTAFLAFKSSGIWSSIVSAGFLCGVEDIQGCTIPIKGAYSMTNNNFVGAGTDYIKNVGLTGDGTKWLSTSVPDNALNSIARHQYVYWPINQDGRTGYLINARTATANQSGISNVGLYFVGSVAVVPDSPHGFSWGDGGGNLLGLAFPVKGLGFESSDGGSSNLTVNCYQNGTLTNTSQTSQGTSGSGAFMIFAQRSTGANATNATLSFWAVGNALTGVTGSVSAYDSIIATLLSSIV